MGCLVFGVIFSIACCLLNIEASVEVFETKHLLAGNNSVRIPLMLNSKVFDKDKFVHLETSGMTRRERNITVYLFRSPFENVLYSCNLTLKGDHANTEIRDVRIQHLGKDRGLIQWLEDTELCYYNPEKCPHSAEFKRYVKLVAIHFPTCKAAETRLEIDILPQYRFLESTKIIAFAEDTFYNIFSMNPELCQNRRCRMSIDYDGKIISGPTPSLNIGNDERLDELQLLDTHSWEKGYVYVKYNFTHGTIAQLTDSHGSEKLLGSSGHDAIKISVASKTIGVCIFQEIAHVDHPSQLRCMQYDLDGNLKWEWSTTYDKDFELRTLLSMDNDGLLLFFRNIEIDCLYCHTRVLGYSVKKIDATGKYAGELHLRELEIKGSFPLAFNIWKNEETKGYCAAAATLTDQQKLSGFTIIHGNCFTDADFS